MVQAHRQVLAFALKNLGTKELPPVCFSGLLPISAVITCVQTCDLSLQPAITTQATGSRLGPAQQLWFLLPERAQLLPV